MTDFLRRSWAEIDLSALSGNVCAIRKLLGRDCRMMGVVKADAYGHGDSYCALTMERGGVDFFGVSNLDEALSLRAAGIKKPVLILGVTPPELVAALCEHDITQTVFSPEYARELHAAALAAAKTVRIHIKIDTGMSRIGFDGYDTERCAQSVFLLSGMECFVCEGIFTHFCSADEPGEDAADFTREQFSRFMAVTERLSQLGMSFLLRHCCNSAATLRYPEMQLDMVRPGLILYGLYPDECCKGSVSLSPVMALKSVISMVKTLPAGRVVSYGRTFSAPSDMKIATLPIGYADGYHRSLSGRGQMLIAGRRVPVVGRVCMDQLMLDVSAVPAAAGDEVTIIGENGGERLSVEEMAAAAGSINYELVCLIGKRVPRLYLLNGAPCGVAQYYNK